MPFSSCPYLTQVLCMFVIMLRSRSSTSSRDHDRRMEFWLISRPDTATPPALDALPGAYSVPDFRNTCIASGVQGILAPSATAAQPLLTNTSASFSPNSFCVAHGRATSHLTPHGVLPA